MFRYIYYFLNNCYNEEGINRRLILLKYFTIKLINFNDVLYVMSKKLVVRSSTYYPEFQLPTKSTATSLRGNGLSYPELDTNSAVKRILCYMNCRITS